jgi:SAM-dependent methyltransferase
VFICGRTPFQVTGQEDGAYAALTEAPGGRVSVEGANMRFSRYIFGAETGAGGRLLEVGCGPGLGLGLLSKATSFLVGADYDSVLLKRAQDTYGDRIPLVRLDVQSLPFPDGFFDTVLFYESSYYVPDMELAFDEFLRVLSPGGHTILVNANPERADFIPSPFSVHYHTAEEFRTALERRGFRVLVEGAYPVKEEIVRTWGLVFARRLLSRLGLIPNTLRGRTLLKRLLGMKLVPVPSELGENFGQPASRVPISPSDPAEGFKVLYITATRILCDF